MVNRGGYVDVLQMLECLRVEEAKRGPRGEGNPNPHASDDHVRDHHAFFLVGLELVLRKSRRSDEWGSGAAGLPLCHCELPPALCHNLTPRSYGYPDHECPDGTLERLSMTPKDLQRGDHYSKTTDTSVSETHSSNQTAHYCSQADQSAFQNVTVFPRDDEPQ